VIWSLTIYIYIHEWKINPLWIAKLILLKTASIDLAKRDIIVMHDFLNYFQKRVSEKKIIETLRKKSSIFLEKKLGSFFLGKKFWDFWSKQRAKIFLEIWFRIFLEKILDICFANFLEKKIQEKSYGVLLVKKSYKYCWSKTCQSVSRNLFHNTYMVIYIENFFLQPHDSSSPLTFPFCLPRYLWSEYANCNNKRTLVRRLSSELRIGSLSRERNCRQWKFSAPHVVKYFCLVAQCDCTTKNIIFCNNFFC
jgi:hypothetical protein